MRRIPLTLDAARRPGDRGAVFKGMRMNHAKATESPILHTIGFDISTDPDRGTVVLIDGHPHAIQDQGPYGGFLPAELFSEQLPLLPGPAPHRVAIAPCECGVTECGTIMLLVGTGGADEELVVWTDFRDRGSAVSSPSDIEPDDDPDDRARITHDDLVFDRVQYEAAVLAAGADRTWETPAEATARLLQGMLVTDTAVLLPDALFVRDGDVITSAGVSSGIDLALALVEDDFGPEVARKVARQMVVFLQRPGRQSQLSAPSRDQPRSCCRRARPWRSPRPGAGSAARRRSAASSSPASARARSSTSSGCARPQAPWRPPPDAVGPC